MLTVATEAAYSVRPLAADALPWLVRVRLRSARKKRRNCAYLLRFRSRPGHHTAPRPIMFFREFPQAALTARPARSRLFR
jgi:hypothetical protein